MSGMRAEITTALSSSLRSPPSSISTSAATKVVFHVHIESGSVSVGLHTLGLKDHILLGNRTGLLVGIVQVNFDPAAAGEVLRSSSMVRMSLTPALEVLPLDC